MRLIETKAPFTSNDYSSHRGSYVHCSEKATKEEKGVSDLHGAFSSLACENIGFTYWPQ